jgi:hypothetical protein
LSFTVNDVDELQVFPTQMKVGPRQSALDAQLVLQVVAPQTYGEQLTSEGVPQLPVPLQMAADVSVLPVHVEAMHCDPTA